MRFFRSVLWSLFCWNVCLRHCRHDNVAAFAPSPKQLTATSTRKLISPRSSLLSGHDPLVTRKLSLTPLRVAISPQTPSSQDGSSSSRDDGVDAAAAKETPASIPFVIEELKRPNDRVLGEICQMCIDAFFNDEATTRANRRRIPFFKEWQLRYLRSLQQADLKRRRRLFPRTNMMFVARRVIPATTATTKTTPLLLDLSHAYNLQQDPAADYCRGEILGFVEVTQRPYSLAGTAETVGGLDEETTRSTRIRRWGSVSYTDRPVLTNLSVRYDARKSGVGSRLLDQCERQVLSRWNLQEIILEVEDDNRDALEFYAKRGYKVLFEDPASRKYDTNGLILRQLRCRRKILRKSLTSFFYPGQKMMESAMSKPREANGSVFGMAWQRFKKSVRL